MSDIIKKKLADERSFTVVKANEFIQKTRFNLSLLEQKTILYIISHIKPEDKSLQEYEFKISDYCRICAIEENNGGNYQYIKRTLKGLRDKSFWMRLENGAETTVSWLERVTVSEGSGTVRVCLDPFLKPYLIQLKDHFTQYELLYTLAMKSQYSLRLYEILKSYQYLGSKRFNLAELKETLFAENYTRFPDFRRNVLDIAVKEINELSDLEISYCLEKEGRRYAYAVFQIADKGNATETLEAWQRIHRFLETRSE